MNVNFYQSEMTQVCIEQESITMQHVPNHLLDPGNETRITLTRNKIEAADQIDRGSQTDYDGCALNGLSGTRRPSNLRGSVDFTCSTLWNVSFKKASYCSSSQILEQLSEHTELVQTVGQGGVGSHQVLSKKKPV